MRRNVRDPQNNRQTQSKDQRQGLQRSLPINPARQQEVKPNQTCVMRLDCQADRQTQDARGHKPVLKEAPDGHNAETDGESGGVAKDKEHFAVGKNKADQEEGNAWRRVAGEVPHQESG